MKVYKYFLFLTILLGCVTGLTMFVGCATSHANDFINTDSKNSELIHLSGDAISRILTFKSGATVEVPFGFQATLNGNIVSLVEPDKQVDIFLIEHDRSELSNLIDSSWKSVVPNFDNKVDQTMSPPPPSGWDDYMVKLYIKNDNDKMAQAVAQGKDTKAWILFIRGDAGAIDKRSAQIMTFWTSLKVPGMEEVDLSKKQVRSISETKENLDAFISDAIVKTAAPGLAIAVVEGDQIVFAKGYGVKELSKNDKITPDTLMMIGSVTKSMTTLMMASLVDQKIFSWTDKVTSIYPKFRVGDDELTKKLRMEDLVCACSGLPRRDLPMIFN
jgi:hypothetical protein